MPLPKPSNAGTAQSLPALISTPVPMDVDAVNPHRIVPPTCHQYGKLGHFQKNCPQKCNIWFMIMEERDEWMNKEALQRDAEEIAEMAEKKKDVEGFPKCRE